MKCDEKCCWLATVIHSFLFPVEQHLIFVSYLSVLFFVEDYLFNGKTNHKSFSLQPNLIDCTILYFEMFVILCASDCLCIKPIMTSCCRCFKTHKYMCGSLKLCLEKKWVVYVSGSKVWCVMIQNYSYVLSGICCGEPKDGGQGCLMGHAEAVTCHPVK